MSRGRFEALEPRVVLDAASWVGDVDQRFGTNVDNNSNWQGDILPIAGDTLVFGESTQTDLENDFAPESIYALQFASGDYIVGGNSITLSADPLAIQSAGGEQLINAPLLLSGDTGIDIADGAVAIAGGISGTGVLAKTGDGTFTFVGEANTLDALSIEAGTLQVDGTVAATTWSLAEGAGLVGTGAITGTGSIDGSISPAGDEVGLITFDSLTFTSTSSLVIQIGRDEADELVSDQVAYSGTLSLGGTIEFILGDGYIPEAGDTFNFLVPGGTAAALQGTFADAFGLFSADFGDVYFDIIESNDGGLSLIALAAPGGLTFSPSEDEFDEFGKFLSDYFTPTPFGYDADFAFTGGVIDAAFVEVYGEFAARKERGRLLIGADSADVFMGGDWGTEDAMGIAVSQSPAGVVAYLDGGYALSAQGDFALIGLRGMKIEGAAVVEVNTTGVLVDEAIPLPSGEVFEVYFEADELMAFTSDGEVTIKVPGALDVVGVMEVSRDEVVEQRVKLDITEMSIGITPNGFEVMRMGGQADFGIIPGDGFVMEGFAAESFEVLGVSVGLQSVALPSEDVPPDELLATGEPEPQMVYPKREQKVDVRLLNRRGYLEVQFHDYSGLGIENESILSGKPLFELSGAALGDAEVDWEEVEDMGDDLYRFHLKDSDPSNDIGLFIVPEDPPAGGGDAGEGENAPAEEEENNDPLVTVSFLAGKVRDRLGRTNAAKEVEFEVIDGSFLSSGVVELGPLLLEKPSFGIDAFSLQPTAGANGEPLLTVSIGVGLDYAALKFGSKEKEAESKFKSAITGLHGSFDIGVTLNVPANEDTSVSWLGSGGPTGGFSIEAELLELEIQEIVKAKAEGLVISYDPNGEDDQEILKVDAVEIEIPKIKVVGQLNPYVPPGMTEDDAIPGLVVRKNGFHLGEGVLKYDGDVTLGSIIKIVGPAVTIANFGVTFGEAFNFSGEIGVSAQEATLFPDKEEGGGETGGETGGGETGGGETGGTNGAASSKDKAKGDAVRTTKDGKKIFSLSLFDGSDADDVGVRASLAFKNNVPSGFRFKADQVEANFGSFLTIFGAGIEIDTTATGDNPVAKFGRIGASVSAGPLAVSGEMRNFGFLSDGTFQTYTGFGVFFSAEGVDGEKFKWPKWLPIRVDSLGITWKDINADPGNFSLIVSASVAKSPLPLEFEGSVSGLVIDVGLLREGKFPITALESISVSIGGNMGGAKLGGTLIGGILRINEEGELIAPDDFETPVSDRVFFVGVEGKLEIAKKGFMIRFALSELGPLGVLVSVKAPLVVDPVFTGLTIDEMTGGVEFYTSVPEITEPEELDGEDFEPAEDQDAAQWLAMVKQQVVRQVKTLKANPNVPGFLAAFTSPFMITARATLSSTHLGSAESFNASVELRISTDGRMYATGLFRFMNNRLVVQAKIYADLSRILSGNARVLFLGNAPFLEDAPDVRLLVLKGKFEMRFFGPGGEPIDMGADTQELGATLAKPVGGSTVGKKKMETDKHLDVVFQEGPDGLDVETITDEEPEIRLWLPDGSRIVLSGVPEEVSNASEPNTYRYPLPADLDLQPGEYQVEFLKESFADPEGGLTPMEIESFTIGELRPTLSAPRNGGQIDVRALNESKTITVQFLGLPEGVLDEESIMDAAPEFLLGGAAAAGVVFDKPPRKIDDITYEYEFSGSFGVGPVTVEFPAEGYADTDGNLSPAVTEEFTAVGPTASLLMLSRDVHELNELGYVDVWFEPSSESTLLVTSILDEQPEFTVSGPGLGDVEFYKVESLLLHRQLHQRRRRFRIP
jgi:hypothetical protein